MKATETTVLSFIGGLDKVFIIPPFQRNYEWSEKECRALFEDIINSCVNNKNHYLGNVVYYEGENNGASFSELILVDGQQRVTTILLILCALRDKFKELGDEENYRSINRKYLSNETSDDKFRIRLKQTRYDQEAFKAIVDNVPFRGESKVIQNYFLFKQLIDQSSVEAKDIYNAIPKLQIVDVNLQITNDLTAVQTIFEKINSTGKPLEPADLIRNFLLLAKSSREQEYLYENYWVHIESEINTENISRFSRDFLIMKLFEDVPNESIYPMFKDYVLGINSTHENVLDEMYRYSKYYAWLKFYNCPNNKINKKIELLNFFKSDDLYPLYMYLLERLYLNDSKELIKILDLLANFMLRYRIVSPSGGGGALRTAIQQLLESISTGKIAPTYDNIYFELSNSPTPASRFPDDEEFKKTLMDNVSTTYARALLLQIEEHERFNIPVELSKVTIEHLMPQTLSAWWIDYLGGEEASGRIYDTYLNCIGNLAPISQSYNTKNSNKPWNEKIVNLRAVQFGITSETANNPDWKENEIKKRNEDVANRACEATISPLPRTRKFQTKNSQTTFVPGLYELSDLSTPMEGASMQALVYNGTTIAVYSFRELFNKICEIAYEYDSARFKQIVESNVVHKSTSNRTKGEKDPVITSIPSKLVTAVRIGITPYYSEGTLSSYRVRVYAKQLLEQFGNIINDFQILLG